LRLRQIDLGGALARHDVEIALNEPRANVELLGLALANERQHCDTHVHVAHTAPETRSVQAFRAIVGQHSRAVVNGKVVVHQDAQGIDAAQSIDGLILADDAEFDAKPELEIYADSVKCSHGTTVGEIDIEQLFYMRARGLDLQDAHRLLVFAFANALLRRMEWDAVRERIAHRVAGGLMDDTDMEGLS
jgi:Fe-S cluster assembly protein SufD